jgi:alpha-tubulin suppressor-like RCC1 family protein
LGTGVRDSKCDDFSYFSREDPTTENTQEADFKHNDYYTWQPQPLVALLGKKIRKIQAGKEHFLALASNGKIYTWGDNSRSQLGLDVAHLL